MTKSINPLFGFNASGTLKNALTFRRRDRQTIAEIKPIPKDARTSNQLAWRTMYQKCADLWHTLSLAEQQTWESLARRQRMTGYSYYMSLCLRPNPGIYLPLAGGTMQGDVEMNDNALYGRKLHGCKSYLPGSQVIQTATITVVQISSIDYDFHGEFNPATYKYTATKPGPYLVAGMITYLNMSQYKIGYTILQKNGVEYSLAFQVQPRPASTYHAPVASDVIPLLTGDFITLASWHSEVGPLSLVAGLARTFLSIAFLG